MTKPKKQTLKSFVLKLNRKLTPAEMSKQAAAAGIEHHINSIYTILTKRKEAEAKALETPAKLAHFKTAKSGVASTRATIPVLEGLGAEEAALRLLVAKLGTLRARQILDAIERGMS